MYHVAIVEDEASFSAQLQEFLNQYQKEHDVTFKLSVFSDGAQILSIIRIFMILSCLTLRMPQVNGMQAAQEIRRMDTD